ncbi:methyltransferase (TIGR00027 family) [Prauserella sediminis]|uniref:S-adenosyl-L-methionine-dependent methyltransferase n=1 Tax=Prauserella sediminis TaxID=577680 RepID=A0A839XIX6_9PSEU|nr:SAM-dependent methyltransferase [Prauserella sediminis]MBB3663230.1 methyltransferase (TIGR00027 family) [Prauserella sediminis]
MVYELRDWDIVSGVGITALGVAAARAVETSRTDALVRDPYAAEFVRAAESPIPMPTRAEDVADDDHRWSLMSVFLGLRSRYLDEYLLGSHESAGASVGARQVVLLAAGLDSRAFRLPWPEGATVYEVDQPRVLQFKDAVLAHGGAEPACERRGVPIDLRDDWAAALAGSGFDPAAPTSWLAEGLMPYLPADAAERLLTTVHKLSAPGSTIAVEYMPGVGSALADSSAASLSAGLGIDLASLLSDADYDPNARLSELGWAVDEVTVAQLAERYGRTFDDEEVAELAGKGRYLTARKH